MQKNIIKRSANNEKTPTKSKNLIEQTFIKENQEQNCKIGELDPFLLNSINKANDKIFLLKLDKELENFIKNSKLFGYSFIFNF